MSRTTVVGLVALVGAALSGCGSTGSAGGDLSGIPPDLLAQARPLGRGVRFHPPARGPVLGRCTPRLGPRAGSHVEVFAENRVVLVAAGIGTRPPVRLNAGRIVGARCYGALVTLEPTGVVLVRPGTRRTVADLFRSWGQPLSSTRLGSFAVPPGTQITAYVNGRPRSGPPGDIQLAPHAEIVLEVGEHVPPHRSYTFPPGA